MFKMKNMLNAQTDLFAQIDSCDLQSYRRLRYYENAQIEKAREGGNELNSHLFCLLCFTRLN